MRTQPWITSSSPTVATTSDNHSAPEDRGLGRPLHRRKLEHHIGDDRSEAAADALGDDVADAVPCGQRAGEPVDEGDDGVEVGARHGTEHQDQTDQRAGGGSRVLQQLKADIVGRQAAGHDPGADHGDDQEPGAERFGDEPAGEVEAQRPGTGLDLVGERPFGAFGHGVARVLSSSAPMRSRSSSTAASNAFAEPAGTGSAIDQCSQSSGGSSSSWA